MTVNEKMARQIVLNVQYLYNRAAEGVQIGNLNHPTTRSLIALIIPVLNAKDEEIKRLRRVLRKTRTILGQTVQNAKEAHGLDCGCDLEVNFPCPAHAMMEEARAALEDGDE